MIQEIALGSDHAGFELKERLRYFLTQKGYKVQDFGTYSSDSMDYPDVAHPLALSVEASKQPMGILVCGSANGVAITANKHQGIRAAICWAPALATLARQHNNANVLCLPARFITPEVAEEITLLFINTPFEGGRHQNRVQKIGC
jgi:ribose 5-phosphate isomerase B